MIAYKLQKIKLLFLHDGQLKGASLKQPQILNSLELSNFHRWYQRHSEQTAHVLPIEACGREEKQI